MSTFAFIDDQRKIEISAEEARKINQDYYFCPNVNCNAHLILVRKNGLSSAYFRCLPMNPHDDDCEYSRSSRYTRDNFDEKAFNLEVFKNNLYNETDNSFINKPKLNARHNSNESKGKIMLSTVCQLYHLLKSIDVKSEFNGIQRASILCDQKSAYLYTKYVSGFKLIESTFFKYNNDEYILSVQYKGGGEKPFIFDLYFHDSHLYKKTRSDLFNSEHYRDKLFVVAGTVVQKGNSSRIDIVSGKQIYITK